MGKPKFTFCIPNLNKRKYLPACIESVLSQDCKDWRCVFVDGYSNDGSWEYMQQYASDPRFLLLRGQRQGMYADWNECLKYVETEYFYFLTSDDTCFSDLITKTTSILDSHKDVDVCHFDFALIDPEGNFLDKIHILSKEVSIYSEFNNHPHRRLGFFEFLMHFVHGAVYTTITSLVFRKKLIEKLEGFNHSYGTAGDYDWTMRMCLFTDVIYIPELLATWRIYPEQASNNVSYIQYHSQMLDIARNNLNKLDDLDYSSKLIDKKKLLSPFLDNYASILCKTLLQPSNPFVILKKLYLIIINRPSYVPRTIIKHLSRKKFCNRNGLTPLELTRDCINRYNFDWKPVLLKKDE